jgi:Fe(II)/alpha-ketoglutarate-dependent arginine beta-hydroxylase
VNDWSFVLTRHDLDEINTISDALLRNGPPTEDRQLGENLPLLAQELPRTLREFLIHFRFREPDAAYCVIRGFPIHDDQLGPTPGHWRTSAARPYVDRCSAYLLLLASLLGEPFGWASVQEGRLTHDVLPTKGDEERQVNSASTAELMWHCEDSFHPYRPDYVGLLSLRNDHATPTTIASLACLGMPDADVRLLFETAFRVQPDESHDPSHPITELAPHRYHDESLAQQRRLHSDVQSINLLFGDPAEPYARVDPYQVVAADGDGEAGAAFGRLCDVVSKRLSPVVLHPGDVCFIDNFRAVHGRRGFTARFDGRDRWLKRVLVTRDLRRSRAARTSATSHVLV